MSTENNSMIYPKIEGLLERSLKQGEEDSHSKFRLVTLAAQRARQINAYRNQLDGGLGVSVPPQVHADGIAKPLSISFEEEVLRRTHSNIVFPPNIFNIFPGNLFEPILA